MPPDTSELVDIVNENNIVVGQMAKHQAHQQGLLHRTVISEIINPQGQWLLVKQAGDRQDPGQYVSPVGGHVRAGESEDEPHLTASSEISRKIICLSSTAFTLPQTMFPSLIMNPTAVIGLARAKLKLS